MNQDESNSLQANKMDVQILKEAARVNQLEADQRARELIPSMKVRANKDRGSLGSDVDKTDPANKTEPEHKDGPKGFDRSSRGI